MTKILITGSTGMLSTDFIKLFSKKYKIYALDKTELDIRCISNIKSKLLEINPDLVLNCAAYTNVDNAEDIGMKLNYDINSIGVYNLAKITSKLNIDFITISTDYVFDGLKEGGYTEKDLCNPINQYGMSKYLGEKLSLVENNNSIIIRTSWLYGGGKASKNFVNTMVNLSKTKKQLNIINDQFGIPTSTIDLSYAISKLINNISKYRGNIFHFSNSSKKPITWFDFSKKIFKIMGSNIIVNPCNSFEYKTKAKRPKYSILLNSSDIVLRNWEEGVREYLIKR